MLIANAGSVRLHTPHFCAHDSISGPCITSSPSSLSTPAKRPPPLSLLRVSTHSRTTLGVGKTTRQKQIVGEDREIFEEEMVKTVWVSSNRSHLGIITAFHGRLVMSHAKKRQTAGKRGHIASNIRTSSFVLQDQRAKEWSPGCEIFFLQASCGRSGKHQPEQNSPNLGPTF